MSQILINFFETKTSSNKGSYDSTKWAADYGQIKVSEITNGLRVSYTLGDTTQRFLLPGVITAESFENNILKPMLAAYEEMLVEYCQASLADYNFAFIGNDAYTQYEYGCISTDGVKKYLTATQSKYAELLSSGAITAAEKKALDDARIAINEIFVLGGAGSGYGQVNPERYRAYVESGLVQFAETLKLAEEKYPIIKEGEGGTPIYVCQITDTSNKRINANRIKQYAPEYTFQMMYEDEDFCGYVDDYVQKPVFRCALEYTLNSDGTLSVALPASSIIFDETVYTLRDITPLKYFGAGDMSSDGYVFFPDGSGTIVNFRDFYKSGENISLSTAIYGQDYCYSSVTGKHREQVTMPVYGVVNEVDAGATTKASGLTSKDTVTNGFFAIFEEGAALANLGMSSMDIVKSQYAMVYSSYVPNPSDTLDLSDTISVGSMGAYYVVSESKYSGSYVTRIVMLTDDTIGQNLPEGKTYYPSTYVGMATYYRDYLKARGVLTSLQTTTNDLPLYIEALGSMEIVKKILTFPTNVSIPLTTFEDISTIYSELSDAKGTLLKKADEYQALADEINAEVLTDEESALKQKYLNYVEEYKKLSENVQNVINVNFKLTGFVNGGMNETYPVKVKWERVLGGKRGFKKLVSEAHAVSSEAGKTFGVYPDFDFMYINNTSMFDGIRLKKNVSKMVDNRYASKQYYNSITSLYESFFNLVVSPDRLDALYTKFIKKYSKYDHNYISVSTLGSDLNSNFDKENPINRNDSVAYVEALLSRMSHKRDGGDDFTVMLDKGNIYSVAYADHIIDACIDSSHFRYSSNPVPFVGLVLHSYVNYTGSAFNYAGSPDYELLRAIENGASLYYLICYQNTAHLKEDVDLNKYYGIDYNNWFDDIVKSYTQLNAEIGALQNYEIVDHEVLISERAISDAERVANYVKLVTEIRDMLTLQIQSVVDAKYAELQISNPEAYDSVALSIDLAAIKASAAAKLFTSVEYLDSVGFDAIMAETVQYFVTEYPVKDGANQVVITVSDFEYYYKSEAVDSPYKSQYSLVTGSVSDDDTYMYTDYTSDDANVVVVTYRRASDGDTVKFILNYNTYAVNVTLGGKQYTLSKYAYAKITD